FTVGNNSPHRCYPQPQTVVLASRLVRVKPPRLPKGHRRHSHARSHSDEVTDKEIPIDEATSVCRHPIQHPSPRSTDDKPPRIYKNNIGILFKITQLAPDFLSLPGIIVVQKHQYIAIPSV